MRVAGRSRDEPEPSRFLTAMPTWSLTVPLPYGPARIRTPAGSSEVPSPAGHFALPGTSVADALRGLSPVPSVAFELAGTLTPSRNAPTRGIVPRSTLLRNCAQRFA